jgi:hypothetical protein
MQTSTRSRCAYSSLDIQEERAKLLWISQCRVFYVNMHGARRVVGMECAAAAEYIFKLLGKKKWKLRWWALCCKPGGRGFLSRWSPWIIFFNWPNLSSRITAQGLAQPLTEMSTRKYLMKEKRGRCVWLTNLPPSLSRMFTTVVFKPFCSRTPVCNFSLTLYYGRRGSAVLTTRYPFIRKSWH